MTAEATDGTPKTEFEAEFGFLALGDDLEARVVRAETLLAGYLRASLNQYPSITGNFVTIYGVETLPVPRPETVERLLDNFRDPSEVQARVRWELDHPERNPS